MKWQIYGNNLLALITYVKVDASWMLVNLSIKVKRHAEPKMSSQRLSFIHNQMREPWHFRKSSIKSHQFATPPISFSISLHLMRNSVKLLNSFSSSFYVYRIFFLSAYTSVHVLSPSFFLCFFSYVYFFYVFSFVYSKATNSSISEYGMLYVWKICNFCWIKINGINILLVLYRSLARFSCLFHHHP